MQIRARRVHGGAVARNVGEHARPLAQRREKYSPLRDVAGMLRSFDYAGAVAELPEPGRSEAVRRTQAAGLRQRREGLSYRLARARLSVLPRKRVAASRDLRARLMKLCLVVQRVDQDFERLAKIFAAPITEFGLAFGVGLHWGEVEFGNIGTRDRLDFTVIGPAVNIASRLQDLTKIVGTPILASADFAFLSAVRSAERCARLRTSAARDLRRFFLADAILGTNDLRNSGKQRAENMRARIAHLRFKTSTGS